MEVSMNGAIVLEQDGKTILINNVQVEDENVYQFLASIEDGRRVDGLASAIRIGAIGLRRMALGQELDYVQNQFEAMVHKFDRMFDPAVRTSHLGHLSSLLETYFAQGGTVEKLLDPSVDGSPLGKLRKTMLTELAEVKNAILKKEITGELVDITALKGGEFEDACEDLLGAFVSQQIGDELERTTSALGKIAGSFAGDFVVGLRDRKDKRIVLETKDRWNMTQPKILQSLESALENRDAQYGIYIAKYKEQLPKKIGWFNEFRGNMLVCALGSKEADTYFREVLSIAYQWARLKLTKEVPPEEKALETIAEGIREIGISLDAFSQIQTQCTNVDSATKEIRKLAQDLHESIGTQIDKIKQAIARVTPQ
jgi:hypothetical protein